jgi:DivIVA domain-containing protein
LFWFMLIALAVVVAAVALAVLGDGGALKDAEPERIQDRLPPDRPLVRADVEAMRLPVGVRGYRMDEVDEVLDRLGAELAERDARIAELEASLAGVRGGGTALLEGSRPQGPVRLDPHTLPQPGQGAPYEQYGPADGDPQQYGQEYGRGGAHEYRPGGGQEYGQEPGRPEGTAE